jgi:hypothetical protein
MARLGEGMPVQKWKRRLGRVVGAPRALHHDLERHLRFAASCRCLSCAGEHMRETLRTANNVLPGLISFARPPLQAYAHVAETVTP